MLDRSGISDIDDSDIDALADMMSDRDDSVRNWIAVCWGKIGPRAHRAVPALKKALADRSSDCESVVKSSAEAIQVALGRIE